MREEEEEEDFTLICMLLIDKCDLTEDVCREFPCRNRIDRSLMIILLLLRE